LKGLTNAFKDKFGDKREGKYSVKELNSIKKMENETMEELNQRFNVIIKDMTQDYKPHDKTVLEKYLEAFCVEPQYEIRHANPVTLAASQSIAGELEKDKRASGKSEILGFERGPVKSKGKEIKEEEHEKLKN